MTLTKQIAKHLRDVHYGGNWTGVNLKETLADVSWQEATTKVHSFHPIATLVFHMNYYVDATLKVFHGGPLDAHDEFSFDHAPIESQQDWEALLEKAWSDTDELARLIEELPDEQLWQPFVEEKYGSYCRCLLGPIEHYHYHLGQISMIKSLLRQA